MPCLAIIVAAARAGGFVIGSILHEVSKRLGVGHEPAKASYLLIKNEQLCSQESLKKGTSE